MSEVDPQRRIVRAPLHEEFVSSLFCGDLAIVSNLPDDATFVRAYEDKDTLIYYFVFQSEQFEPVKAGEVIPKYELEVESVDNSAEEDYSLFNA